MSAPRCERVIGVAAAESVGRGGGKKRVLFRPNGALALGMRVGGSEGRDAAATLLLRGRRRRKSSPPDAVIFFGGGAAHAVAEQGGCCSGVYGRWGVRKEGVMGVSFLQAFLGVFLLFFSVRFPPYAPSPPPPPPDQEKGGFPL